jgi:hypothetical protein
MIKWDGPGILGYRIVSIFDSLTMSSFLRRSLLVMVFILAFNLSFSSLGIGSGYLGVGVERAMAAQPDMGPVVAGLNLIVSF